jgi:hypothetical protein
MHRTLSNMEEATLKVLEHKLRRNIFIARASLPKHIRLLMGGLARGKRLKSTRDLTRLLVGDGQ